VAGLYARLDEVKSVRIQQALRVAKADVLRNQSLVRLQPQVGNEFREELMKVKQADFGRLAELYQEWGFRSLLAETKAEMTRQQELFKI
jgi:hypothetical protein